MKILLAKNTKALYRTHFSDFFKWAEQINTTGAGSFNPCSVSSPQDISYFWKVLGRGGSCKRDENFCHCCQKKSSDIVTPNLVQCVDCVWHGNSECFHQLVCDAVYVEASKKDLEELIGTYNDLFDDEIVEKTYPVFANG